uniref:G-protein coupled receptors family 1 profile domain-containing protein n=1 Tax=Eptatretus burgeri TaxID=7764 RepID=A0A8C4QS29_EPTBU
MGHSETFTFDSFPGGFEDFEDFENYTDDANHTVDATNFICCTQACETARSQVFNRIFIPVAFSFVFILGFLGNILVIMVLTRYRQFMASSEIYMLHLALADLLFVLTLPFWVSYFESSQWNFGKTGCKLIYSLTSINFYSSIFLLCSISLDRYLAIVHAIKLHSCRKTSIIQIICATVWILSLLFSLPDIIVSSSYQHENRTVCELVYSHMNADKMRLTNRIMLHVLAFIIPLLFMFFCYSNIIITLRSSRSFTKHKVIKVIMAVVIVFFICWLPYNITIFVDTLVRFKIITPSCEMNEDLDQAIVVTQTLGFLHCCLNPFLYVFIGVKFRNNSLKLFREIGCISDKFLQDHTKYRKVSGRSVVSETDSTASVSL